MIAKMLFSISGTLWAIEMLPQIYKTYKIKSVQDISLFFPSLCFISFCCFLTASFMTQNWILVKTHIFPFVCNTVFLIQTLIYRRNNDETNRLY